MGMMDGLIRDVRQALRLLGSHRGFAVAALLTIALGVGGTATVFSVVTACCYGRCRM